MNVWKGEREEIPVPERLRKLRTWFFFKEWRIVLRPFVPRTFLLVEDAPEDRSRDTRVYEIWRSPEMKGRASAVIEFEEKSAWIVVLS